MKATNNITNVVAPHTFAKCLKDAWSTEHREHVGEFDNIESNTIANLLFKALHELDMIEEGELDEEMHHMSRKAYQRKLEAFFIKWAPHCEIESEKHLYERWLPEASAVEQAPAVTAPEGEQKARRNAIVLVDGEKYDIGGGTLVPYNAKEDAFIFGTLGLTKRSETIYRNASVAETVEEPPAQGPVQDAQQQATKTYRVFKGASVCAACTKRIGNVVEIDGKHYGTDCAETLLGKKVSAPAWLYELAEAFANNEADDKEAYDYLGDLFSNFWNQHGEWSGTDERPIVRVNGERVTIPHQEEVNVYLREQYSAKRGAAYCEYGGLTPAANGATTGGESN